MRYKIYNTTSIAQDKFGFILTVETDSLDVAEYAFKKIVENLGSSLIVIMIENERIIKIERGAHVK